MYSVCNNVVWLFFCLGFLFPLRCVINIIQVLCTCKLYILYMYCNVNVNDEFTHFLALLFSCLDYQCHLLINSPLRLLNWRH